MPSGLSHSTTWRASSGEKRAALEISRIELHGDGELRPDRGADIAHNVQQEAGPVLQ